MTKPSILETFAGYLGKDIADIRVKYPGGLEVLATAHNIAQEAMQGIELDLPDVTLRQARRILAARNEIARAALPEVSDLHAGEDPEHNPPIRVGTLADIFHDIDRNPRWGR